MNDEANTDVVARGGTRVRDDGTGPILLEHRHRLVVVDGPDRGIELALPRSSLTIGTAPTSDLVLTDPTVSRRHCVLEVEGERYLLRDLGSTNGTIVDGTPVREAFLAPGARIVLGDTEILFQPRKKRERIGPTGADHFGGLYGRTERMRAVFALLERLAPTDLGCILAGETGTGKELAARAIHAQSPRAARPFVVVDCSAISETLVESELFGHERGAFTGAERQRLGAFELADGGTVFLDEIGELPLELQPKLLRVLERKEIKRLGGSNLVPVDVRVVAATNRDLVAMIGRHEFRQDLYYRLAEVVVQLPPLRARMGDLPVLAERLLAELAGPGEPPPALSADAIAALSRRSWPGNVRELRNVLRRAVMLSGGGSLTAADLHLTPDEAVLTPMDGPFDPALDVAEDLPLKAARERWTAPMEREYLVRLVRRCAGELDAAAEAAGIHRKSLERLLRQHGLKAADLRG